MAKAKKDNPSSSREKVQLEFIFFWAISSPPRGEEGLTGFSEPFVGKTSTVTSDFRKSSRVLEVQGSSCVFLHSEKELLKL